MEWRALWCVHLAEHAHLLTDALEHAPRSVLPDGLQAASSLIQRTGSHSSIQLVLPFVRLSA